MFKLFDDSKRIEKNESEDVAHLAFVEDEVSDRLFCGILEQNGIPFMRKERGMGISTRAVIGYNFFGTDIYVRRDRLDEARELYRAFSEADIEDFDIGDAEDGTSSDDE